MPRRMKLYENIYFRVESQRCFIFLINPRLLITRELDFGFLLCFLDLVKANAGVNTSI